MSAITRILSARRDVRRNQLEKVKMENFRKYLADNGIADSRTLSLATAFNQLHRAYCELDYQNRYAFDLIFGSDIREGLIKYADHCPYANADLREHVQKPVDVEIVRNADVEDINGMIHS